MTDPTRTTPAETALVDVLLRADPMLDADEAQHLLSALAAPANRDALVAWLVEAGIAERPTYPAFGQESAPASLRPIPTSRRASTGRP